MFLMSLPSLSLFVSTCLKVPSPNTWTFEKKTQREKKKKRKGQWERKNEGGNWQLIWVVEKEENERKENFKNKVRDPVSMPSSGKAWYELRVSDASRFLSKNQVDPRQVILRKEKER